MVVMGVEVETGVVVEKMAMLVEVMMVVAGGTGGNDNGSDGLVIVKQNVVLLNYTLERRILFLNPSRNR